MAIRTAAAGDASHLGRIHISVWQHAYRHVFPSDFLNSLDVERRVAWFAERIESDEAILVAEDGLGVAGFCHVGPAREQAEWGEVYAIYLLPRAWGTGLGRDLLSGAEQRLRDAGHEQALLWVLEDNPRARAFYERQGWSVSEQTVEADIGGVTVTELRYVKDPLTHE